MAKSTKNGWKTCSHKQIGKQIKKSQPTVWFLFLLFTYSRVVVADDFWRPTYGPPGGSIYAFANDPSGRIFAASGSGGVFVSVDSGKHWKQTGRLRATLHTLIRSSLGHLFAGSSNCGCSECGVLRSTDDGRTWSTVNNGLTNKVVRSITESVNGQIFAGTSGGGVFRSTDNGENWMAVNNGLTNLSIGAIVSDSTGNLFAGTFFHSPSGVFRSTNNGESWTLALEGIQGMVLFTNNEGLVLVGTPGNGVFRSTDHGETWTPANTGLPNPFILSFCEDSNGGIFLGTNLMWPPLGQGIFYARNKGESWTQKYDSKSAVHSMIRHSNGSIFAAAELIESSDQGETWLARDFPNSNIGYTAIDALGNVIAVNSREGGIFRLVNETDLWKPIGFFDRTVKGLVVAKNGNIFAGVVGFEVPPTPFGINRSTDNGETWTMVGLANYDFRRIATGVTGLIYAGADNPDPPFDRGVYRSTDYGISWSETGLMNQANQALGLDPIGNVYAGTVQGAFRSSDDGVSWTQINNGLPDLYVQCFAFSPDNTVLVGTQNGGVARSTNSGLLWTPINTGLTSMTINCLAIDSLGRLLAGTGSLCGNDGGVFVSIDKGDHWSPLNNGLTVVTVRSLIVDRNGFIFAGTDGGGVFKYTGPTLGFSDMTISSPSSQLYQNYPNPFNPRTTIVYHLANRTPVSLKIFSTLGSEVISIFEDDQEPGHKSIDVNATGWASGVYYYRLQTRTFSETKKFILLR